MADYTPINTSCPTVTANVSAAVTGGQILAVSGSGTVAPAGAGSTANRGVAAFDCASGGRVMVWPLANSIHQVTAAAAITAGQTLKTAAGGQVTPWVSGTDAADLIVGKADTTAASGALVRFTGR